MTQAATRNLNKIIDVNFYPVETARRSNMRHRPIGLGVQGLADTFLLLGLPFDSEEAAELNRQIFETIYFAALRTSMQLAKTEGEWLAGGAVGGRGRWGGWPCVVVVSVFTPHTPSTTECFFSTPSLCPAHCRPLQHVRGQPRQQGRAAA